MQIYELAVFYAVVQFLVARHHGLLMFKPSYLLATLFLATVPLAAFAQSGDGSGEQNTKYLTILPFIAIGVFFFVFILFMMRKQEKSPALKRHQDYLEKHERHMERIEQLMERIAKALEKDKRDA